MRKQMFMATCGIALLTLNGCGLIVQPKLVTNRALKDVPIFDPNEYNITVYYEPVEVDGGIGYKLDADYGSAFHITQHQTTRIKYKPFADVALVEGKIKKHRYPVLFDTGNSGLPHITTTHVQENLLPIYPLQISNPNGYDCNFGIAMLFELQIGDISIYNLPAAYRCYHTGYLPFGVPLFELGQDKDINIPFSVIQKFKYFECDNIKNELEFSKNESFKPSNPQEWKSYSLIIEEDIPSIKTTIEGVPVKLMVDTGCAAEIVLTKNCFDKICERQPRINKSWKLKKSAFAPLMGGSFPVRSYLIPKLTFDKHPFWLSTIVSVMEEGPVYEHQKEIGSNGIVGFPFFEDTVMVLDFENETMWVKKSRRSRFEK